MSHMPEFNIAP